MAATPEREYEVQAFQGEMRCIVTATSHSQAKYLGYKKLRFDDEGWSLVEYTKEVNSYRLVKKHQQIS